MNETHEQERELAKAVVRGDTQAGERFCRQFAGPLFRFVYYRVEAQEAEDVFQEIMAEALEALERYQGRSSLFSWLCGIAKHKIADHYRQHAREEPFVAVEEVLGELVAKWEEQELPECIVRQGTVKQVVNRVLSALPPHYQTCLKRKYLQGGTLKDISQELKMTEEAVGSLLARAREAFRRAFQELSPSARGGSHERPI